MLNIGIIKGLDQQESWLFIRPRVPEREPGSEKKLIEKASSFAHEMINNMSRKEIQQVSFMPLVLTEIAWIYAQMAREAAAHNRLEMFRDMGRVVDLKRKEYEDFLALNLDYMRRTTIKLEAEALMGDFERDFEILYWSCNQELKRVAPEYYYEDVRTPAIVSIEMVGLVRSINKLNDALLAKRIKGELAEVTELNPYTAWLGENMECYAGVDTKTFNYKDRNILTALAVIKNRAIAREYNILNQ